MRATRGITLALSRGRLLYARSKSRAAPRAQHSSSECRRIERSETRDVFDAGSARFFGRLLLCPRFRYVQSGLRLLRDVVRSLFCDATYW